MLSVYSCYILLVTVHFLTLKCHIKNNFFIYFVCVCATVHMWKSGQFAEVLLCLILCESKGWNSGGKAISPASKMPLASSKLFDSKSILCDILTITQAFFFLATI